MESWCVKICPNLGAVYAIDAVKQMATLTPIKTKLRWNGKLAPNSVGATTSTRGLHGNN
jgi:hypothetical protein